MSGWLDRITGGHNNSANQAKERLKLVLIHDRTDLSNEDVNHLKSELMAVIRKYIEIDPGEVRILVNHDGREQRLVADVPLRAGQRRRVG
ncbi:MAG: cell division topological specificity factor MinE [Leptolinea sp.]|mgnify:CR=1 FL=1|nr:cell division topological specificity factor MinE [Leptolinea sp.]